MNIESKGRMLLFWDYDTQWGADRSRSGGGPKTWGNLEFENTDRLLELHAKYAVPACFAVVGAAALPGARPYHDPIQIREIQKAGHEVASHSFHHDWLPGLGVQQLRDSLLRSKRALEDCIGSEVVSFVPPWNQPVDYFPWLSISLSERRQVREDRTDFGRLCDVLAECGYLFSRTSCRPLHRRILDAVCRRRIELPVRPKVIRSILTVHVNTPCGFDEETQRMLHRCAKQAGLAVVYGHPHSLTGDGPQSETHLVQMFETIALLREKTGFRVLLPKDLLQCVKANCVH